MGALTITALYVPASRPDRFATAVGTLADVIIADLEDAIAASAKEEARAALDQFAEAVDHRAGQVRINAAGTPWHDADCTAVGRLPVEIGVRLPKCETADQVRAIADRLPGRGLHVLIESALGVENAFQLAQVPGVATIALGESDLRSQLGVVEASGLAWARGRIVNAAHAAGLPAPLGSVYASVHDLDGLRSDTDQLKRLGFLGRTVIHPGQIDVVRKVFRPTADEVAHAHRVIDGLAAASDLGDGTLVLPDGSFADVAMVAQQRRVLELEEALRPS